MSSDEESIHNVQELSDNEQYNEILEIGENLPDQEEQTEEVQRDDTADGEGADADEAGDRVTVKPKRIIRNPRPKLNAETLKGPKGIAALESYFERVKFKGKGGEQQDLEVVMKTYEYWCHRLFPKFPFDTCIEKLETLGNKKAVQTHIRRIRFDLLIEDKPIVDSSDEEPNVEGFVDIQNDEITQQQNQRFDQLLMHPAQAADRTPVALTEEQLERIRLNKERAERLKQQRLSNIRDKAEERLQGSSQLPGTSGIEGERGLVLPEAANNTQSDIFSQEDHTTSLQNITNTQDNLNEIEMSDTLLFDHESNVKGKGHLKGTIIKKSTKFNKRTAVFNSDSETSNDDNGVQNSSVGGFAQKKKSKRNIIYDSEDDQSSDEENQKQKNTSISKTTKLSSDDGSEDENYPKRNNSHKKHSKHSVLMDTDESDQEKGLNNQPSKEINAPKTGKKSNDLDNNISGQELSDLNKANSLHSSVENSSDSNHEKSKCNIIYDSEDDQSSDEESQKQKELSISKSTKLSSDGDLEDDNHTKRNISHEKQSKHSVLMDTDKSDQEKELNNQASKEMNAYKTRNKSIDSDNINSDQELLAIHEANRLDGLVENSSDLSYSGSIAKTNIKIGNEGQSMINNDLSINGVNGHSSGSQGSKSVKTNIATDNLVAVVEMDERLNSDEPMEIIEAELEALLTSN